MSQNDIIAKVREIKSLQQLIEEATAEVETLKDELKDYMKSEGAEEITADLYKVRLQKVSSNRFDTTAFKKNHADLYERYCKTTTTTRFTIQ